MILNDPANQNNSQILSEIEKHEMIRRLKSNESDLSEHYRSSENITNNNHFSSAITHEDRSSIQV